jgi:hypothetical protein
MSNKLAYYMTLPGEAPVSTNCTYFPALSENDYLQILGYVWNYSGPVVFECEQWVNQGDQKESAIVLMGSWNSTGLAFYGPRAASDFALAYGNWSSGSANFVGTTYTGFGKWTKIRVEHGGSANTSRKIYFDNVLVREITGSVGPTGTRTNIIIGSMRSPSNAVMKGWLRDVKIYQDGTLVFDAPLRTDFVEKVSGSTLSVPSAAAKVALSLKN